MAMRSKPSEYDLQAQTYMKKHGFHMRAVRHPHNTCPLFCEDKKHIHGVRYAITFTANDNRPPLMFDFWNSWADEHPQDWPHAPKKSAPYSVLACISGDIFCPDTFHEFCSEYNYDEDSRKALKLFEACQTHSEKLREFFQEGPERDDLEEIR